MNHDTHHTDGPGRLWIWQPIAHTFDDADVDHDGEWDAGRIRPGVLAGLRESLRDNCWAGVEVGAILHLPYGAWTKAGPMEANGVIDFLRCPHDDLPAYIRARTAYAETGRRLMDYIGAFHPAWNSTLPGDVSAVSRLIRLFGATDVCVDTLHGMTDVADSPAQVQFNRDMEQNGIRVWGEPAPAHAQRRSVALWRWYQNSGSSPKAGRDVIAFTGHTTRDGKKWDERHVYQALLSGVDIALPGEWGLRHHVDDVTAFVEIVRGCVEGDAGSLKLAYRAITS